MTVAMIAEACPDSLLDGDDESAALHEYLALAVCRT
jgi:hypothetical protein